jgi:hypothetical protein
VDIAFSPLADSAFSPMLDLYPLNKVQVFSFLFVVYTSFTLSSFSPRLSRLRHPKKRLYPTTLGYYHDQRLPTYPKVTVYSIKSLRIRFFFLYLFFFFSFERSSFFTRFLVTI